MTVRRFSALLLVGLVTSGTAMAQPDDSHVKNNGLTCFNGYGYTLKGGDYRYTEHHQVRRVNGKITTWNVTYVGARGKILATKHLDFAASQTVPTYTLKMTGSGYQEGITHHNGQWTMFRQQSADADRRTKNFQIDQPMAADSGFNQLVQEHFQALQSGKTIPFKFAAAGRQAVVDLKAFKTGTTTFEGKPAVNFKAELDMFLVNLFVSSLKLTYSPQTHRLLEYRGIGNIQNDNGKVYPVRVSYYSKMPAIARKDGAPAASCGSVSSS
ncbi:MAG: hypothetical protein PF501_08315 [Salinisphaera sp.]|nr:hypothetical protein [Salinisphaera sp.]